LQAVGVSDGAVLRGVKEDKDKMKFHLACNRLVLLPHFLQALKANCVQRSVFEYTHQQEIKRAKEVDGWGASQFETIIHPNEYFKRSYLLRNPELAKKEAVESEGVSGMMVD